ncbi:hypothetical protein BaRGS_00009999 [Batillaria attramentaria]|uniref:DNA topoisomerase I n=1 Tax=Batillaria attramentaria TaxID=370345 RepID=A0ABD0LHT4_9CAEN
MASLDDDRSPESSKENHSEANETASAADLKAKIAGVNTSANNNSHASHNGVVNHISDGAFKSPNGVSSSSSSSKHKERPKDGSSSSSKHHSSSSSSSSKHKSGSSSSSKHRESSSGGSSSKPKDGSSSSSSSKHKEGSSSSSHREGSSSKHREDGSGSKHSSSDKHRDKDGSSSSSSKHKDSSSSSSKPKESSSSSSSSKPKEGSSHHSKDRSSSEHRHSSSSDKHKSSSSSSSDKHRDKSKEHSSSSSSKSSSDKHSKKAESPSKSPQKVVKAEVKQEPDSDEDEKPLAKKIKKETGAATAAAPGKKKKKDEEQEVWKWWEEEKRDDGVKWHFLEHKGPVFAPPYEPLPPDIKFYYNGKPMKLSPGTEEVATFYSKMLDHDYTTKEVFNQNFFKDWRKVMTKEEKEILTDLKKCNFTELNEYFKVKNEERKNMSKEEKLARKKENEELVKEYGFCTIDGHKEKIGNFKIEPPGLFRGRGDHPKQGMLKRRVVPEDIIINCSKDSKIPQPPEGHKWKEVRHDNHVTWLASWTENIQGQVKYIMLNAASKLKGEKDWQKYEVARRLHRSVDKIRAQYREDWKSKEMRIRQRAVALYFIDKLALRAGNEKEEGETADTVGCCSLRVEHLTLHEEKDGKHFVVDFDFLGKDSIRYTNSVPVEKRVFKNLQLFMENKQPEDDIFDRLNTTVLNKHLQELMEGLTAKVFRTYNASHTLQEQLNLLTNPDDSVAAKILSYNRANRAVAVLCNHQRAVPKTFAKSMENLQNKITAKKKEIKQVKKDIKDVKADYKATKTAKARTMYEKKKKMLARLEEQLVKLEVQATDKDENKEIALGTSKLNYLDPRISVAWCKKFDVPIEKIYNKTQRDKFRWAIDMATADFQF